jgi:hypothetical protein
MDEDFDAAFALFSVPVSALTPPSSLSASVHGRDETEADFNAAFPTSLPLTFSLSSSSFSLPFLPDPDAEAFDAAFPSSLVLFPAPGAAHADEAFDEAFGPASAELRKRQLPETAAAIEDLALAMIERIMRYEDPTLVVPGGLGLTTRGAGGVFTGARDFCATLKILASSHELLTRGRTATQRELYYCHKPFFASQPAFNRAVGKARQALGGIPRYALGILAASRGWFCGAVSVCERSEAGELTWLPASAPRPIPSDAVCTEMAVSLHPGVRFVLVVEKECIFRRLAEARLWERGDDTRCVILTGCGMPDLATRAFARQLYCKAPDAVRFFALVDHNPFGAAILVNFRLGSRANADADAYNLPTLEHLGLCHGDFDAYGVPRDAMMPTTELDDAKARALLLDEGVRADAGLVLECTRWLESRQKCELEALTHGSAGEALVAFIAAKSRALAATPAPFLAPEAVMAASVVAPEAAGSPALAPAPAAPAPTPAPALGLGASWAADSPPGVGGQLKSAEEEAALDAFFDL